MKSFWLRFQQELKQHQKLLGLVFLVLLLSLFLRFFKLAQVPHGMTWDEAAIGYNGYAILHTRRDEWLVRLPISFKSFGDYKAPLAIYLNGLFTWAFGMNLWAVRLPFALSGVAAVLAMMLLMQSLNQTEADKQDQWLMTVVAGLLLSLSPWHLHFSRAGFESGMSLMWLLLGIWGLQRFVLLAQQKQPKNLRVNFKKAFWLLGASTLLMAAIYTYHSAKVVVPLLILVVAIWQWRIFWQEKFLTALTLVWTGLLLRPLIIDAWFGKGLTRSGTLVFSQGLSVSQLIITLFKHLLIQLSPQFLVLGQTTTLRHGDGRFGVLLPTTLLLVIWLLVRWINKKLFVNEQKLPGSVKSLFYLGWCWVGIGLLPAALGTEVPHSNRALLALPGLIILASLGLSDLLRFLKTKLDAAKLKLTIGLLVGLHLSFFVAYQVNYYTSFAHDSASDFKDGYLQAFEYAVDYEKGLNDKPQVDKILFTSDYGQPYIYALFVRKTNPIWYQGGSLVKYEFADKITVADLEREKTLIVASESDQLPIDQAKKVVYGSDGQARFKFYLAN
ncbi:MAG: hypothetical protein GF390_01160 [Candidatus Pacebacteria bacterium]|nr:hypothetical protein [Candidatus Paceibacterota bacterium]